MKTDLIQESESGTRDRRDVLFVQGWHSAASLVDAMKLLANEEEDEKADGGDDEDGNESAENGGGGGGGPLPLGRSVSPRIRHERR